MCNHLARLAFNHAIPESHAIPVQSQFSPISDPFQSHFSPISVPFQSHFSPISIPFQLSNPNFAFCRPNSQPTHRPLCTFTALAAIGRGL